LTVEPTGLWNGAGGVGSIGNCASHAVNSAVAVETVGEEYVKVGVLAGVGSVSAGVTKTSKVKFAAAKLGFGLGIGAVETSPVRGLPRGTKRTRMDNVEDVASQLSR
jgi:hypothetical protein